MVKETNILLFAPTSTPFTYEGGFLTFFVPFPATEGTEKNQLYFLSVHKLPQPPEVPFDSSQASLSDFITASLKYQ